MAVSNTLLLEKRVVADWDEWKRFTGKHSQLSSFISPKNYIAQEKVEIFKETVSFHLASNHSNYLNLLYFHIFYIRTLPAVH